jgi:hypothetical protein
MDTPRGALRANVIANAERLGGRAVGAALDESVRPEVAARLCLDLIEAVDPKQQTVTTVTGSLDPEALDSMSFRELLSFAQDNGIHPSPQLSTAP